MSPRRLLAPILLIVPLFAIISCDKHNASSATTAPETPDVVTRLCQHIIHDRQKLILDKDQNQPEIIWSDGAILEVGSDFPPALRKLISHPTGYRDIRTFLKRIDAGGTDWKVAAAGPSSEGDKYSTITSRDATVHAIVESIYIEYLHQRYPEASIRIRTETGPILFVVDGQIRASVMPFIFH